ncbi:MAG: apolipoprotein N-acyltransferase [Armatimonadota bacterium]
MDTLIRKGQRLLPYAPAAISALLLTLAFAPLGWWWTAWIAIIPWYVTLQSRTGIYRAARTGLLFGVVVFLVGMFWMNEIGAVPWFVLAWIQAVPFALLGLISVALLPRLPVWARPLVFAAIWTLLEFGRSYGRFAFPWFLLSTSQVHNLPILQLVSATGQWGLSFCIAFANGLLGEAWLSTRRRDTRALTVRLGAAAVAVPILLYISGLLVMGSVDRSDTNLPTRLVGAVQGSFDKESYGDAETRERVLTAYLNLTRDAVIQAQAMKPGTADNKKGLAFVAWPETVVPGYISREPYLRGILSQTARALQTPLLIGAPEVDEDGSWLNTAYLFDRNGLERERYDKNQLVPIGEFFPLRALLGTIYAQYNVPEKDHAPGTRLGVMEVGGITGENRMRVGTIICYESVFPKWARDDVRGGAQMIALLTSDQTFGTSAGPQQHADIATVRAVETRRWIVRAAATGVSEFLSPTGRIKRSLPLMKRGFLVDSVTLRDDKTLYVRWGDWVLWVCAGICLVAIIAARRPARSAPESTTAAE